MPTATFELTPPAGGELCDWRELFAQLRHIPGPKELILRPGCYRFGSSRAIRWSQPATNSLEAGCDPTRPVALYLQEIDDLTIRGNGALLEMQDDLTALGVDRCRNLTLSGFRIDYRRPRVSEMRVEAVANTALTVAVHPDSTYRIHRGRLEWTGIPHAAADLFQILDAESGANLRTLWNPQRDALRVSETAPGRLLFQLPPGPVPVHPGDVLLCRTVVRDRITALFHESENLRLDRLHCYAGTGLGFTFQMCNNIAVDAMFFAPEPSSGRNNSAFADHLHFSGCRGRIAVTGSYFAAGQDDPINVHGTYLAVTAATPETVTARFMHTQSWGFNPFHPGDEVALIDPETLVRQAVNRVRSSQLADPLHAKVALEAPWPPGIDPAGKFLENLSAYPEVAIRQCRFACYPTRGILLSSAKTSVIEECEFEQKAPFAAILIAGDARSWYESGAVTDVTIRRNRFRDCPVPAIEINPEVVPDSPYPVHGTVRIHDNEFHRCREPHISAHHLRKLESGAALFFDPRGIAEESGKLA